MEVISDILVELLTWADIYVTKTGTEHVSTIPPSILKNSKSDSVQKDRANGFSSSSSTSHTLIASEMKSNVDDEEEEDGKTLNHNPKPKLNFNRDPKTNSDLVT
jgi:hypothetical protein